MNWLSCQKYSGFQEFLQKEKNVEQFWFQELLEIILTVILIPHTGNLGSKWRYGVSYKSTKSENLLRFTFWLRGQNMSNFTSENLILSYILWHTFLCSSTTTWCMGQRTTYGALKSCYSATVIYWNHLVSRDSGRTKRWGCSCMWQTIKIPY